MNDTEYHQRSEEMLNALSNALEELDSQGVIEVDTQPGILSIRLPDGKQLLLSKHTTTQQLWLSSPVSGGLHFIYSDGNWILADGRTLYTVLSQELTLLAGVNVTFQFNTAS